MRISVGLERTEISAQRKWDPARWNIDAGRALGTKEDARMLNTYLDTLQSKVYEAQRQLIANQEEVTIENLRRILEGRRTKSKKLLVVFREHNSKLEQLINKDFAAGTHERYETALKLTSLFLQWKYKISDIDIQDLNYEFVTEMEFWLKSVRSCSHNTAVKYISNVKKIVNICLKNGWLDKDPFIGYKLNKREVVREILTQEEIDTIASKTFPTERLAVIRDVFVFSCYTGLAYADVKKLKRSEIGKGLDGEQWIFTQRAKTEAPSRIFLSLSYGNRPVFMANTAAQHLAVTILLEYPRSRP